jgi:hypothetical protein
MVFMSVSPDLYVYAAQVAGSQYVSSEAILLAADIEDLHILWVRPGEVAERIEALPGIKAATVRTWLPARVTIAVDERKPLVRWYAESQRQEWWLDNEGVVLPYGPADSEALIVVDLSGQALGAGDRVEPPSMALSLASVHESLPGIDLLYYHPDRGLSLTWRTAGDEWPVYLGSSDDLEGKLQSMEAINDYLSREGIRPRFVDVSRAEYPVYGEPAGPRQKGD